MFRTLRSRLLVGQLLPLLVIVPLMGLTLIYVLETRVLLPGILRELEGQARLVVQISNNDPGIWSDPAQAQAFVARVSPSVAGRLMLLDVQGKLLASSNSSDVGQVGRVIPHPALKSVLAGAVFAHNMHSQPLNAEIVDVLMPVFDDAQHVIGIVRLSYMLQDYGFFQLRYIVIGVVALGILLGGAVGWGLALNLGRPLRQMTEAIFQLANGERLNPLPKQELEEIDLLTQAFNTLVERTRSLEVSRRLLLSNLVHELGRPLGAAHSAIQALQDGAAEDKALRSELFAGLDGAVRRLRRLLDDLSRLQEQALGPLELNPRPVRLTEWLPQVLALWRTAARSKALRWQVDIPEGLPEVELDPDRIEQALGNLLSNAIQYTPTGGFVSVEAGAQAEAIWIKVKDTGAGISPESLPHIFEPFYRGQMARRFPQGMGLGLSITRDLITAHGGHIEVKSTLAAGSSFTLWLPLSTQRISPQTS